MDTILIVILVIEILLISYIEYKHYNGFLTPTMMLGIPFLMVLFLAITVSPLLGFNEINYSVIHLWIIGIMFFWLGGLIGVSIIGKKGKLKDLVSKKESYSRKNKVDVKIKALAFFIILILAYYLKDFQFTNISYYNEDNTSFLLGGIPGHAKLFLTFIVIGMMINQKSFNPFFIIIMLCFLIIQVVARVKAWIFLPFISAGIGRYIIGKFKLSFNKLITIFGSSLLVFYVFFYLSIVGAGKHQTMKLEVASNFFMSYFFSGILGMSEHTKRDLPIGFAPEKPFAIFYNIAYKISGNELMTPNSSFFVKTHEGGVLQSNTRTFFGYPYMFGDYPILILYALLWGFISYFFMLLCYSRLDNIWILSLYSYYLAGLFFGWFGPYFTQPSYIEIPLIAIIVSMISIIKFKSN